MTRIANARIAGVTFLAYIVAGITDMVLRARAIAGTDIAGKLASIAQHARGVVEDQTRTAPRRLPAPARVQAVAASSARIESGQAA